jgi:hypothetical protein
MEERFLKELKCNLFLSREREQKAFDLGFSVRLGD